MTIHPTAIVEDGVVLGADVEIGPFCLIRRGAELADGVRVHSHVVINGATRIGARTEIYDHAALGGDAQIRGDRATAARLIIGEDCVIREHVTMSAGSPKGHGLTRVGRSGYFMAYSHSAHDCTVGDGVTFANGVQLGGHVDVGEGANFGGLSAVQQFGRVGRFAFVGGVTGVNEDVIPYGMVIGSRARLTGLNLIGLKRRNIPREHIHALRGAFRVIFQDDSKTLASRAQAAAERWPEIAEVQEVVRFILADAKRPVCTARRRTGVETE
ncbi:MAG: acyl-ACP--UDP-N-acetylglucosamine O-acyltransferase [Alphaproteobacteria bacterium]|nr:acyl-ACP--UDP-N-acetylglucosamine O-acyltransferase [Alphaproteobacteria bacterium]